MTKSIFIYFSYSGDNEKFAKVLESTLNCDILRLIPENEYTNSSIKILFQGGNESLRKKTPSLKKYDFNPQDYDLIILGGPVWAWTFAPVLRSFLASVNLDNKNIVLTCSHRGSPGKTIEHLQELLPESKILLTKELHAPVEDNSNLQDFIRQLQEIYRKL